MTHFPALVGHLHDGTMAEALAPTPRIADIDVAAARSESRESREASNSRPQSDHAPHSQSRPRKAKRHNTIAIYARGDWFGV